MWCLIGEEMVLRNTIIYNVFQCSSYHPLLPVCMPDHELDARVLGAKLLGRNVCRVLVTYYAVHLLCIFCDLVSMHHLGIFLSLKFALTVHIFSQQEYICMLCVCYLHTVTELLLVLLQDGDPLGRKWWGWRGNPSMVPAPGFINLLCELIITLEQYSSSLQPYKCVLLVKIAPKVFCFPPNWGSTL